MHQSSLVARAFIIWCRFPLFKRSEAACFYVGILQHPGGHKITDACYAKPWKNYPCQARDKQYSCDECSFCLYQSKLLSFRECFPVYVKQCLGRLSCSCVLISIYIKTSCLTGLWGNWPICTLYTACIHALVKTFRNCETRLQSCDRHSFGCVIDVVRKTEFTSPSQPPPLSLLPPAWVRRSNWCGKTVTQVTDRPKNWLCIWHDICFAATLPSLLPWWIQWRFAQCNSIFPHSHCWHTIRWHLLFLLGLELDRFSFSVCFHLASLRHCFFSTSFFHLIS